MSIENKLLSMADGEAPKRSAEDGGSQHYKRARGGSGSDAGRIELRVLIQSKHAGGIIGKGGDTIKRLRVEYSANVGVPDCNGPERILTIKADMNNVIACLIECIPLISEADDPNSGVRLLVHQSHAGAIIGRAGYKIKDLRQKTTANIKVYTELCPNSSERIVQVNGTPEVISNAVRSILELIDEVPIKGLSQKYDPFCFDEFGSHLYGGFTFENRWEGNRGGNRRGGGGGGGFRQGGDRGGRGGGGGGSGGMRDNFGQRGNRDFGGSRPGGGGGGGGGGGFFQDEGGFNNRRGGGGGFGGNRGRGGDRGNRLGSRGGGGARRGFGDDSFGFTGGFSQSQQVEPNSHQGGHYDGPGHDSGEITTSQVTIPKDLAGSIIGTGGERIRTIRNNSEAKIKIEEEVEGSKDRIITITGTYEQIENAQFMLQNSVRQYSGQLF